MTDRKSIAETAVETLSLVARIDEGLTNDHAERHHIRTLKRLAEQHLDAAFNHAQCLAYLAADIREREARKEAA